MKILKVTILAALVLSLMAACVQAATPKYAGKRPGACVGIGVCLDLTDDQKAAAKVIYQAGREQSKAVWSNESLTKEQKMAQMREIRQARFTEFRALLTPEQIQKLDQIKGKIQRHPRTRYSGVKSKLYQAGRYLGLTDDQKAQVRQIMAGKRDQVKALKEDQSLTREQKISAFKEIGLAVKAEIRSILTPEQQQKFDQMAAKAQARYGTRLK